MYKIAMLNAEPSIISRPIEGVYKYSKWGRLPFLQRILFWILARLNCQYDERFTSVKVSTLDIEDVIERVIQSRYMVERIYHERPKYLVLGRDYYVDLVKHQDSQMYMTYQMPTDYHSRHISDPKLFAGLTLVLVPYMEGMVILPDLH